MTTNPHADRKRDERVHRILRVAATTFAELGYAGASLEEIARRLDMRGPSLYYYFSSKDELLRACLDHTAAEVTGRARQVAGGPGTVGQRLRRMLADQVLVQVRDFPEYMPLFMQVVVPDPDLAQHVRDLRRSQGEVYLQVVDEGVAAGELEAADSRLALLSCSGAIAYVQEWYDPDGRLAAEELADLIADQLMRLFTVRREG